MFPTPPATSRRRVGMQPPSVEVRYRDLSVLSRMTVGDRSLPTLRKTLKRQAEVCVCGCMCVRGGGVPMA